MVCNLQNICKFIPSAEIDTDINVLNFVYEANWHSMSEIVKTSYMMCLVTRGSGQFFVSDRSYSLKTGDLFFVFSAKPYKIINEGELEFCYITFVGARVIPLFERLHIQYDLPFYSGHVHMIPFWKDAIERADSYNSDLVSHSVLYYTFSFIASDVYRRSLPDKANNLITEVRRYIDNNYRNPNISLVAIAQKFGYSYKYISNRFSKTISMSITEYITDLRMEYAMAMISEGDYSVTQISEACGYSDPLYFSKVFKRKFGTSPTGRIRNQKIKTSVKKINESSAES